MQGQYFIGEERVIFVSAVDEMREALDLSVYSRTESECNKA